MKDKSIKIRIGDRELYMMLSLWLTDDGFEITDSEQASLIITDSEKGSTDEKSAEKVLYITDNADKDAKDEIERPFGRLEFLSFIRGNEKEEVSVRVDHKRQRVYNKKAYVSLTDKEYAVFRLLYDRMGEPVLRDEISAVARSGEQKTNAADVYICMLRRKLTELFGYSPIKTVRGRGYLLLLEKRK